MRKFPTIVRKGTEVKVNGNWYVVSSVHESRNTIKVEGLEGSFQIGHVSEIRYWIGVEEL